MSAVVGVIVLPLILLALLIPLLQLLPESCLVHQLLFVVRLKIILRNIVRSVDRISRRQFRRFVFRSFSHSRGATGARPSHAVGILVRNRNTRSVANVYWPLVFNWRNF